jgi:hypothetical protein
VKEADGEVCVGLCGVGNWGGTRQWWWTAQARVPGAAVQVQRQRWMSKQRSRAWLPPLLTAYTAKFFLLLDQSLLSMGNFSVTLVLDGWIAHLRSAPNGTKKMKNHELSWFLQKKI